MEGAPFEALEHHLQDLIETTRQLGIMVTDFQPQTQKALNDKIQSIVTSLKSLDDLKDSFREIYVPTEVFE